VLLAPVYIGGVFLFSYGYELYDLPRALRLTAILFGRLGSNRRSGRRFAKRP